MKKIVYARSLVWGLACFYVALVMVTCGVLCHDYMWRIQAIHETCALHHGNDDMLDGSSHSLKALQQLSDADDNMLSTVLRFWQHFHFPINVWPFNPISSKVEAGLGPCDALVASNQLLIARCQSFFLMIGLIGFLFLVITGESAIKTARFIVKDVTGPAEETENNKLFSLFPCLPWLYSLVLDAIKSNRRAASERIVRISHDLKVPVEGLRSALNELSDERCCEDRKKLEAELKSLVRFANHIDQSASRLKMAAEMQPRLSEFSVSPLCIETMIREMLGDLEIISSRRNIRFNLTSAGNKIPGIYGNHHSVREMLLILLDNAVQYSNEEGVVDVVLHCDETHTTISITNQGRSIPGELLTSTGEIRAADMYSTDRTRFSGVGLSIAAGIASLHRWVLLMTPVNDPEGTVATISIPNKTNQNRKKSYASIGN